LRSSCVSILFIVSHSLCLSIPYETLCQTLKIGDIITTAGLDLPSDVVKLATQSPYVHVAIVHSVDPQAPPQQAILIAESHIDIRLPSVGTGKRILGVQLQWLYDRLAQNPGNAWWTPLKTPLTDDQIAKLQVWLQTLESQQVPYDFKQAIGLGIAHNNQPDDSAFFCSELVTRALQIAGAIDPALNPALQSPGDVMQFPCFNAPIQIQGDPC
jgi:hypothetical protein